MPPLDSHKNVVARTTTVAWLAIPNSLKHDPVVPMRGLQVLEFIIPGANAANSPTPAAFCDALAVIQIRSPNFAAAAILGRWICSEVRRCVGALGR